MPKFKVDENLPRGVVELLAAAGHDAMSVQNQRLGGRPDSEIANACREEERALVTLDLDFADIRAFPPSDFGGIIVLRLPRPPLGSLWRHFRSASSKPSSKSSGGQPPRRASNEFGRSAPCSRASLSSDADRQKSFVDAISSTRTGVPSRNGSGWFVTTIPFSM